MASPVTRFIPPFLLRNLFCTACGIAIVALGIASALFWKRSRELEARFAQVSFDGSSMLQLMAAGPLLRQQHTQAGDAIKAIEDNLVIESNLADNLWHFYKYEEETRIRLGEIRQLNAAPLQEGAHYRVVPYALTFNGPFEQVADYVYRIETGPRLSRVTGFSLQRRETGSPQLTLTLSVDLLAQP